MIYKVEFFEEEDGEFEGGVGEPSAGSLYFSSKAAAMRARAKYRRMGYASNPIQAAETPKTKAEVINLLGRWGGHAWGGPNSFIHPVGC